MAQVGAMVSGAKQVKAPAFSIYDEREIAPHDLGDELWVGDRMFRFTKAGGTTLAPGKLVIAATPISYHQDCLLSAAVAAGGRVLTPTMGATTAVTENMYADGYLVLNKGTGFASAYRVKSHPAALVSATCAFTLYDDLEKAVDTTTEVTLVKNKYDSVIVLPTGATSQIPLGVPLLDVTASYYFWLQVKGPAPVLVDTANTLVIGETCGVANSVAVAGAVALRADQTTICVGRVLYIGTAAEYALVDLTLD